MNNGSSSRTSVEAEGRRVEVEVEVEEIVLDAEVVLY